MDSTSSELERARYVVTTTQLKIFHRRFPAVSREEQLRLSFSRSKSQFKTRSPLVSSRPAQYLLSLALFIPYLIFPSLLFSSLLSSHFQSENFTKRPSCRASSRNHVTSNRIRCMSAITGNGIILVPLSQCLAPHQWRPSNIQYQWIDPKLSREELAWEDSRVNLQRPTKYLNPNPTQQ